MGLIAHTVSPQTTNTKAASYRVNCGCQCSDLTFRDKYNRIQGNCKTADNTGAQWCYTEYGSTCEDQRGVQGLGVRVRHGFTRPVLHLPSIVHSVLGITEP